MIKMLKYHGYEDDGVEGYQCLNCYNHISMRHHAFSITIDYCPFCGCKFEGGFIKDNKHKFYRKNDDGYFRSVLYKMYEKEYRQRWSIEKFSTTYWSFGNINDISSDTWQEVYTFGFDYNSQKSQRENVLLQLRHDMQNESEERIFGGYKEVIEYRLKYYKYYQSRVSKDAEQDIVYYYPKNNKITKESKQRKKAFAI